MAPPRFPTSAQLQDFLLREAGPGTLIVVPHQRLAHQIWHRQRQRCLEQGLAAWEPLPLVTLHSWWADLFQSLWPPVTLAPSLVRLSLWRRALKAGPPLAGTAANLEWAQALDEAHTLLCRHLLHSPEPNPVDPPLVAWRRRITEIYREFLKKGNWLTPGELPDFLLRALQAGKIALPERLLMVGLGTPAPLERDCLQAAADRTNTVFLHLEGDPRAVKAAMALPNSRQEMEWVAANVVEQVHREGMPLHCLAVTSPEMDLYAPQFKRVLREILGAPETEGGWAYNFSQGPTLAETPLFQAALLPLRFAGAERREDLISLLTSPYFYFFKGHQSTLASWDRFFREQRAEQGWPRLKEIAARQGGETGEAVLSRLEEALAPLRVPRAVAGVWISGLRGAWKALGFPQGLDEGEGVHWVRVTALLDELAGALASESLTPAEFQDWLNHGARQIILPGPGIQEAGLQIMGLLELRGLHFSRVYCLGMNAGVLPPPPRPLPLLSATERRQVLGGTAESQHRFARELFDNLLAAAPHLVLTRPRIRNDEDQVATPLWSGPWTDKEMAPLSVPHPAWLMVPAVQAAFTVPAGGILPGGPLAPGAVPLPAELSITQVQTALECPCRFLLETLLNIRELPEVASGLDPRERGGRLHQVLARFTAAYQKILQEHPGAWDHKRARKLLRDTVHQLLAPLLSDLHWQAEWDRWLGDPGLLWEWLRLEEQRFQEGWRWLGMEVKFRSLKREAWPFALVGRIDRIDYHPEEGLVLWDYKSGETPPAKKVFDQEEEFQLPGYLAAVRAGRVEVPRAAPLKAGFIGLKSPREKHLRYEDFSSRAAEWDRVLAAWEEKVAALGQRLAAGDFRPRPFPPPAGRKKGACEYCGYHIVCGFIPETPPEDEAPEY